MFDTAVANGTVEQMPLVVDKMMPSKPANNKVAKVVKKKRVTKKEQLVRAAEMSGKLTSWVAKGLQPKDKIVGNTSRVGKDNICLVTQDTLVFGKSSLGCNLNLDLIANPPLIQNLVDREGDAGDQDAQEGAGVGHYVNNYIGINNKG